MICATCTYEHDEVDSNIPFKQITIGNNEFIFSDGYEDGKYYNYKKIELYICPKCGTVIAGKI